jgi:hypothetical protein
MRALAEGGGQLVIGAVSGWRVIRPDSITPEKRAIFK